MKDCDLGLENAALSSIFKMYSWQITYLDGVFHKKGWLIDSKSRAEGGRGMILNCGRLCLDLKNCLHVYAEGSDDKMNKEKKN